MTSVDIKRWREAQIHEKGFQLRRKFIKFDQGRGKWAHKYVTLLESYTVIDGDTKILDVGCGSSAMVSCMVKGERIGLDPLIDVFFGEFGLSRKISWIRGVGESMPFKNEYFDVILCMNVLDHMRNPLKALNEISRVLKNRGIFMLYVDCHSPFVRCARAIKEKLKIGDVFHPFSFSANEILETMSNFSFLVVYIDKEPIRWLNGILMWCKERRIISTIGITASAILSSIWRKLVHIRIPTDDDGKFIFVAHKTEVT